MDDNLLQDIVSCTMMALRGRECTMSLIDEKLSLMLKTVGVEKSDYDEYYAKARLKIEQMVNIKVSDSGYVVNRNVKRWLTEERKGQIKWSCWSRYKEWLKSSFYAKDSIERIDADTDKILTLMGDPKATDSFKSRGLIIGDVQSGKTGTYTGLISKAADAGYKVIIVIAGVLNTLREQTQDRLERDFVGKTTCDSIIDETGSILYGVGSLFSIRENIVPLTNVKTDSVNPTYTPNRDDICLLVIKKNTKVLDKVQKALTRIYSEEIRRTLPVLLIDDEADHASVNTKILGADPAKINSQIVGLIDTFPMISYVGCTATPYANIFINPDTNNDARIQAQDLFPRDYIYCLGTPSNYIGASKLFVSGNYEQIEDNSDLELSPNIVTIDSENEFMDSLKDGTYRNLSLPSSLGTALQSFIIARIIRDLRHQEKEHCSMLIHIYHKKDTHAHITREVSKHFDHIKASIRTHIALRSPELHCKEIAELKQTWEDIYASSGIPETWEQIVHKLKTDSSYLDKFLIFKVNSDRDKDLDYKRFPDGLTAIVIGGNGIARGLTLEGLTTSYFLRRSTQYDSLMQMGRWFGYRPGYEDICRIFLSQESQNYFAEISRATEELKHTIRRMHDLRMTPMEFGLRVRNDATGLIVTARNKMRSTTPLEETISFSNCIKESFKVLNDRPTLEYNIDVFKRFLNNISRKYTLNQPTNTERQKTRFLWKNVEAKLICRFLEDCKHMYCAADEASASSLRDAMIEELLTSHQTVDVALISNTVPQEDSEPMELPGIGMIHLLTRNPGMNPHKSSNHIVFDRHRAFSEDDEMGVQQISYLDSVKNLSVSKYKSSIYRSAPNRKPLLILSFLKIPDKTVYKNEKKKERLNANKIDSSLLVKTVPVYGISFPHIGNERPRRIKWICNVIASQELLSEEEED